MTYNDEDGLTLTEAADQIGVSRNSLKKRCDRNTITFFIDSKGSRRIPHEAIANFGMKSVKDFVVDHTPYDYDPEFDIPKAEIWGNGKAPVIDLPRQDWVTIMGVNDIHVPYHNIRLVDAAMQVAKHLQPDLFVIGGDTNDFFALSRFNKAMERMELLQTELDMGKAVRKGFREAVPNAQMHEILGNHEERLLTYPGFNAPALRSLNALKPSTLLGLDELDITHWPMNGFRIQEDFLVEHGTVVRPQGGAAARSRLDSTLISGVQGHTHRMGSAYRTGYRNLEWHETGCLCMLNPDYVRGEANWQPGFWYGSFSTRTGNFNIQLVQNTGQGFVFDGRHFGDTGVQQDLFVGPAPNFEQDVPSDFAKIMARV